MWWKDFSNLLPMYLCFCTFLWSLALIFLSHFLIQFENSLRKTWNAIALISHMFKIKCSETENSFIDYWILTLVVRFVSRDLKFVDGRQGTVCSTNTTALNCGCLKTGKPIGQRISQNAIICTSDIARLPFLFLFSIQWGDSYSTQLY